MSWKKETPANAVQVATLCKKDFDIKDTVLPLLKAINEMNNVSSIKGVTEGKLVSWLRGLIAHSPECRDTSGTFA